MHLQYPAENNGNRRQRHPQRKRPIPGVFLHFLNPRQPDDVIRANNEEDCCADPTGKKSRSTDRKSSFKWNESHFSALARKAPAKRADLRTERAVSMKWKPFFSSRSKSTGKKSRSTDRKSSFKWNESHFSALDRKAPAKEPIYGQKE